jgi:hypothetical protein
VFDEARLDDVEALERLDTTDTLRALAMGGAHVRQSINLTEEAGLERFRDLQPRGVVVAAEGGSAAVADIFEAVSRAGSAIPVQVCSSGPLPGWVGAYDLVVAVSLSGRAPGTLALATEAARRGASVLTVGAASSPLAAVSERARGVHVPMALHGVSSRTSVWGQVTPVLLAADAMGLAAAPRATLESVADALDARAREVGPSAEAVVNPAKVLATEVAESIPIVLGSGPFGAVASRRAAAMFGRTGRVPVAAGALPDAASEIVACFDGPLAGGDTNGRGRGDDIFADPFLDGPATPPLRLVLLSDDGPDGELSRPATDAVVAAAEDAGVRVSLIEGHGATPLARLASHVALTDFAATYLALGYGFDPSDSRHVRLLRQSRGRS